MKKGLVATLVALILSLAGNAYLFMLLLDAGLLIDDALSRAEQFRERKAIALQILGHVWIGRPAREVDELAKELAAQGIMVGTEGEIREIHEFLFDVRNGVVVGVRDLDIPDPHPNSQPP